MTWQEIALIVLGVVVGFQSTIILLMYLVMISMVEDHKDLQDDVAKERLGDPRFGANAPLEPPYEVTCADDVYKRGVMVCVRCNVIVNPYDPQCMCPLNGAK